VAVRRAKRRGWFGNTSIVAVNYGAGYYPVDSFELKRAFQADGFEGGLWVTELPGSTPLAHVSSRRVDTLYGPEVMSQGKFQNTGFAGFRLLVDADGDPSVLVMSHRWMNRSGHIAQAWVNVGHSRKVKIGAEGYEGTSERDEQLFDRVVETLGGEEAIRSLVLRTRDGALVAHEQDPTVELDPLQTQLAKAGMNFRAGATPLAAGVPLAHLMVVNQVLEHVPLVEHPDFLHGLAGSLVVGGELIVNDRGGSLDHIDALRSVAGWLGSMPRQSVFRDLIRELVGIDAKNLRDRIQVFRHLGDGALYSVGSVTAVTAKELLWPLPADATVTGELRADLDWNGGSP
jgi:hypothetical protein